MACCVLIAVMLTLPIWIARRIFGAFGGAGHCSMSWRPVKLPGVPGREVAVVFGSGVPVSPEQRFSIIGRLRSFGYAGRGAFRLLRFEHSAWIQLSLAAMAIVAGLALNISRADWRWIVMVIGMVLMAEGFNTAIETVCNKISTEYSEHIKVAKDVAAGAVLLCSIAAAIIGLQTFFPYLTQPNEFYKGEFHCKQQAPVTPTVVPGGLT